MHAHAKYKNYQGQQLHAKTFLLQPTLHKMLAPSDVYSFVCICHSATETCLTRHLPCNIHWGRTRKLCMCAAWGSSWKLLPCVAGGGCGWLQFFILFFSFLFLLFPVLAFSFLTFFPFFFLILFFPCLFFSCLFFSPPSEYDRLPANDEASVAEGEGPLAAQHHPQGLVP